MNVHSLSFASSKTIAILLAISLLLATFGFTMWTSNTQAASLTFVSDLLSDSDLGLTSNHTITFTSPTGIPDDDSTVLITFPGEFNVSTSTLAAATDIGVDHGAGPLGISTGGCVADPIDASISGQDIQLTFCNGLGGDLGAGGTTTIEIGSHVSGGVGDIINPLEAGSYEIVIAGTQTDNASTRVVIIDDVLVTASVDTIFTFVINGLPAGVSVNGSPTTTAAASTATTLPFGTLAVGLSKTLAQNLQVNTNARNGFTVTLNQDQNLLSSTGADIDRFIDDAGTAVPVAWQGPAGTLGTETTYGHMGITSEDSTLVGGDDFGTDFWAGNFVNNAREVFYHDGPANGIAADQGSTTVGFQAEIMAFQEAGTDYQATITYVATPVF
jgi:hypothetical protein